MDTGETTLLITRSRNFVLQAASKNPLPLCPWNVKCFQIIFKTFIFFQVTVYHNCASYFLLFAFYFVNSFQARVIWEVGVLVEQWTSSDWPAGNATGHFLSWWLVWEGPAHYGQFCPCAGGPGWYKEAGRANHERQASKRALPHKLCISSCHQVSALSPSPNVLYNRLWCRRVNEMYPLFLVLLMVTVFDNSNGK